METVDCWLYNIDQRNLQTVMNQNEYPTASLSRQLAAMLYDGFLILALFFLLLGIFVLVKMDSSVPLAESQAIDPRIVWLLFLGTIFFFYSWFWQKSGQALGMRAWKIKIVSELGGSPHLVNCFIRLVFAALSMACFGLGYLWLLFKPYSWHDKLSQTRIVFVGTKKDKAE